MTATETATAVLDQPRKVAQKLPNPIDGYKPEKGVKLVVTAPDFREISFRVVGDTELVQHRFSVKAMNQIMDGQRKGDAAKRGRKEIRPPKDFDALYNEARHISHEGWDGIPASSFRTSMIRACTLIGVHMSLAKMSVFIKADGRSREDNIPLVRITKGKPFKVNSTVRLNRSGSADIRPRPMWDAKWEANVRIRYDAGQFTAADVGNLLHRAGQQVGVGEGRAMSKNSDGCGWGHFSVKEGDR